MSRALIVDANNLIMRSVMVSALDDLKAGGIYTGGMYGALQSLHSIVKKPDLNVGRIVAFFDHSPPPSRLALIPGYKANRKERREIIGEEEMEKAMLQLAHSYELWQHLGVQCLAYEYREADDGIAAAVRVLAEEDPVVVSSDKDLYQCVRMGGSVWDVARGTEVDADNFYDEAGEVLPETYVLYRTLVGDSSDGIKGAYGCGPKRAAPFIQAVQEWDEARDDLPPAFEDLPPHEQLDVAVEYAQAQEKGPTWHQALVEDRTRLKRVAKGIDLSNSFGNDAVLAEDLQSPPEFEAIPFLRACRAYRMQSILGDAKGWLRPFQEARQRLLG